MSNVVKLKEYLIGNNDDGYLLSDISNGKVIMLSGEWGSGKTHFWHLSDDSIKSKLDEKEKPNIYISLYGKSSLQEIENEVFTKAYYKSKGRDDNKKDVIEKLSSTFSKLSSYVDDVSPIKVTPVIDFLDNLKKGSQESSAEELMNEGLIIAFDDFERKSAHINLNDLFGFITNLAIQYKATIVIILNDDVFEGKEKAIFTNVKEKTISKYLKYTPTCAELFEIIFQDKKYKTLKEEHYAQTIQRAFCEVGIVNARILIQILDNLLEWYEKNMDSSTFFIRYFVLVNINFILNHHVFEVKLATVENTTDLKRAITGLFSLYKDSYMSSFPIHSQEKKTQRAISKIKTNVVFDFDSIQDYLISEHKYNHNFVDNLKVNIQLGEREEGLDVKKADYGDILIDFVNTHQFLCKSLHYMYCFKLMMYAKENSESEVNTLNSINTFIETGIL